MANKAYGLAVLLGFAGAIAFAFKDPSFVWWLIASAILFAIGALIDILGSLLA